MMFESSSRSGVLVSKNNKEDFIAFHWKDDIYYRYGYYKLNLMYYCKSNQELIYNNKNNHEETQIMIILSISQGTQVDKIFINVLLHST